MINIHLLKHDWLFGRIWRSEEFRPKPFTVECDILHGSNDNSLNESVEVDYVKIIGNIKSPVEVH